MTVTVTTNPDASQGFQSPLIAQLAVLATLAFEAIDASMQQQQPGPQPGPQPDPQPEVKTGFTPQEVTLISGAIRQAGVYEGMANPDLFLGHLLQVILNHQDAEPSVDVILSWLNTARVDYSGPDVELFPISVAQSVFDFIMAQNTNV